MGWSRFRPTGLTYHYAPQSFKGYTLITPAGGGDASYLIDMAGRIVHRWRFTTIRPWYARLEPNGHLLANGVDVNVTPPPRREGVAPVFEEQVRRLGGNVTHLLELDWEGNIVWSYEDQAIHHDFLRLANGNTLLPRWVELEPDLARRVRGGYRQRPQPPLLADDILEIDPAGKEVRRIHLWQLLDPVNDPICPLEGRNEWTHLNGLDLTADGGIVFSCRDNSRVGIIDPAGDRLRWKYGFPNIAHQHNATVLANGNIQIFDNGMHRRGMPRSAVVEVNPKDNSVVWQFTGEPEQQFLSGHISGAQRLANENTLVCEGASGRIFEVTRRGETVWEWVSPFVTRAAGGMRNSVFRAHRYAPDFPGLAGRDLDWERHRELNRMFGLCD